MTEKPREDEGGLFYKAQSADTAEMIALGMSAHEAAEVFALPLIWTSDLTAGEDPDQVFAGAMAHITHIETQYGPSRHWDESRMAGAHIFSAVERYDLAAQFLIGVPDTEKAVEEYFNFLYDMVMSGKLSIETMLEVSYQLQKDFAAAGRGADYRAASRAIVEKLIGPALASLREAAEPRERYGLASWDEIDDIVGNDAYWPADIGGACNRVGIQFGQAQHAMLGTPRVERKNVEALKAMLRKEQDEHGPAEAWDRLRCVAALTLYGADESRFGLGMVRAMTSPEIMGATAHALIAMGRERDAFDAAQEITDGHVFARTLHLGEWQDRQPVDALLTDITVAGKTNIRRYDPDFRVAVAQGLQNVHQEAGDEEWAATMQSRATLLAHQARIGFIQAPKPRKNK